MTLRRVFALLTITLIVSRGAIAAEKFEPFDRDPGWEGLNNHIVPDRVPTVTQDFGYSPASSFAGKGSGEIGGTLTRASRPAYYAAAIEPKTLNNPLRASGTFAMTKSDAAGAMFFGWFNAKQPHANGRPTNSLGFEVGTEKTGGRLMVHAITGSNQTAGRFVTRFERYRTKEEQAERRPTPIRNDGTRYHWTLEYDPAAAGGNGQATFIIRRDAAAGGPPPQEFENKLVTLDLPPGFKQTGATFDRFGLLNGTKPGGQMTIYFDDVSVDGAELDFAKDPGWAGSGNRDTYQERRQVGAHDFGFRAQSQEAGGTAAGELGGDLWRSGKFAYYADRVGPLTFDDRLEASGKVILRVGAPDSDVFIGWFDSTGRDDPAKEAGSFVGVHVGGPTRVGHYFTPMVTTNTGGKGRLDKAPVLTPGKVFYWKMVYNPAANAGDGEVRVTLGDETTTLPLKKGLKAQGGRFDRFGLWNSTAGGQLVEIYLDDIRYTVR